MEELYKLYRPKTLKDVVGQKDAVASLTALGKEGKIPHTLLFTGPSGCGKTTLARIIANKLKARGRDFQELNCAEDRGIEMARRIKDSMNLAAVEGSCRVYLMDEVQQLTKDAQGALLKVLEDTPGHVYFMLCTTDPQKLLNTIKTRSTEIRVKGLNFSDAHYLVTETLKKVKSKAITEDVMLALFDASKLDGSDLASARKVMVLLNGIYKLQGSEAQLKCIEENDSKTEGIMIARLLTNFKTRWPEMAKALKTVEGDPESIRYIVMGYCNAILLNGKTGAFAERCYLILDSFCDNFYDSKKAGLTKACYEVITKA